MKSLKLAATGLLTLTFAFPVVAQQHLSPAKKEKSGSVAEKLTAAVPDLLKRSDVPGLSIALIRDGKLEWNHAFGVKNSSTKEPVTAETVFEAASLTKPVFAYAVLKLIDDGKLDLDAPLNKYLPGPYDAGDDARINKITARHVLSHTTGFPNWRSPRNSKTLPIYFEPGERFSYSGEGFVYLSKVVEKITGMKFDEYVDAAVFKPLGMASSSLSWQEKFKTLKTFNHDLVGFPSGQGEGAAANAAGSLHTTSGDYAKFVIAVLNGTGLKKQTRAMMLSPQVRVDTACRNCTSRSAGTLSTEVAWGVGVGLQTTDEGTSFWHWGDNGNNKAFFAAFDKQKDGIVVLTNGANGLMILEDILARSMPRKFPAVAWINVGRLDSPARVLLRSLIDNGAEKAIADYRKSRAAVPEKSLDEARINQLGYDLLRVKKIDEAIAVFRLNTEDFPASANTWDSLGEAYMVKGDKKLAIEYYKKSLELNPENKAAAENIKKLEH
jgi:CubicO group peptidase (beta-lactamase class C family)